MKILFGSLLALTLVLGTACQTPSANPLAAASAGVTYNPATAAIGGQVSVTFKTRAGLPGSFSVPRHAAAARGYNAAGEYVTLSRIRDVAVAAYKTGQSAVALARARGLNDFDQGTAAIIAASLAEYNADPASL